MQRNRFQISERLPSNNGKVIEEPPFKLTAKTSRLTIKCSNANCQKTRLVYKQTRPKKEDIRAFNDGIEDFAWTCGDRIDDTKTWMVNEKLTCDEPIETLYYSSMVDGTQDSKHELICYGYGDSLDSDVLQKYIDDKSIHIQVKPTCTSSKCDVHKKFKSHLGKKPDLRRAQKILRARGLPRVRAFGASFMQQIVTFFARKRLRRSQGCARARS